MTADVLVALDIAHDVPRLCPHFEPDALAGHHHPQHHAGLPCPYYRVAAVLLDLPDPDDAVAEWRINLPYDRPPLSLNDRRHWAAHAAVVSALLARTRNAYREADIPALRHVHVELHYRPATNRYRDADNIVATLKPCIDALLPDPVSHWPGIVAGDDPRYVSWSPPILHQPEKGQPGQLWLTLRSYG